MPNHVKNVVKMEGITNLPLFVEEDGKKCFDFNYAGELEYRKRLYDR